MMTLHPTKDVMKSGKRKRFNVFNLLLHPNYRKYGWCVVVSSHSICLLLPQWFIFPTRRKTKGSLIYFWN